MTSLPVSWTACCGTAAGSRRGDEQPNRVKRSCAKCCGRTPLSLRGSEGSIPSVHLSRSARAKCCGCTPSCLGGSEGSIPSARFEGSSLGCRASRSRRCAGPVRRLTCAKCCRSHTSLPRRRRGFESLCALRLWCPSASPRERSVLRAKCCGCTPLCLGGGEGSIPSARFVSMFFVCVQSVVAARLPA